jgi:hypothetical protein
MEAGDVMIHWTATMDDGTMVAPPYTVKAPTPPEPFPG